MYVYKITDTKTKKSYIGIDTNPKKEMRRWKAHLRDSRYKIKNNKKTTKFYYELASRPDDFIVEVVFEDNSVYNLLKEEIRLIEYYDTFKNGYNGTKGGECFKKMIRSDEHYKELYDMFKQRMIEFNYEKWFGKTLEERNSMMNWHSSEANEKRSKTIKNEWNTMSVDEKNKKLRGILNYNKQNKDICRQMAYLGSMEAARLSSFPVSIKDNDSGHVHIFKSHKEAYRTLGISPYYIKRLINKQSVSERWEIIYE